MVTHMKFGMVSKLGKFVVSTMSHIPEDEDIDVHLFNEMGHDGKVCEVGYIKLDDVLDWHKRTGKALSAPLAEFSAKTYDTTCWVCLCGEVIPFNET